MHLPIIVALLLQTAPGQVLPPRQNPDYIVALKVLQSTAELYGATPFCYLTPTSTVAVCQPSMATADVVLVRRWVTRALEDMKLIPPQQHAAGHRIHH